MCNSCFDEEERKRRQIEWVNDCMDQHAQGQNFHIAWNLEEGKMYDEVVDAILENGFQLIHNCLHERGEMTAYQNRPMGCRGWCTYCHSYYGMVEEVTVLLGTSEHEGMVRYLGSDKLLSGERGFQ